MSAEGRFPLLHWPFRRDRRRSAYEKNLRKVRRGDCDDGHEYLACLGVSRARCSAKARSLEGKLVNKSQLIDALATRFEGNKKAAAHALESVLDTITREVARG